MSHQIPQRYRLRIRSGNFYVEIIIDIAIQVQLALLDQLHDRSPREQFGDRPRPEESPVGSDRCFLRNIGVAISLLEKYVSILHYNNDCACNVLLLQLEWQDAIRECSEIICRESVRAG